MSIQALKKTGKKLQAGFTLIELMIVVAIIAILAAVAIPNFLRARAKASFSGCMEQLKNIASGMEQEISEVGNLAAVNTEDEVCHHILSGYDDAAGCATKVSQRYDQICDPNVPLAVSTNNAFQYEIKGVSLEAKSCEICVTEVAVDPPNYAKCIANGSVCAFTH